LEGKVGIQGTVKYIIRPKGTIGFKERVFKGRVFKDLGFKEGFKV
jgi:hypothetical protein